MHAITEALLGWRGIYELLANAGAMQREAKKLMKAGDSAERAVLTLSKKYGLSMHDCELLHMSLTGM